MNEFVKDFDIDQLIPWAKNPRINDHAVDKVANSINKFGFASPVLARKEDKVVIAGHTRIKAAKKLKMKKIPVRFLDISKEDAEKLALADNKLGEIADWDEVLLKDILSNFDLTDQLDLGWTKDELTSLLDFEIQDNNFNDDNENEITKHDHYDDLQVESEIKYGDKIELGNHVLYCSDNLEIMRKIESDSIDSIVTDPPYGIDFLNKSWDANVPQNEWARECLRILKPGGHLISFAATRTFHKLVTNLENAGFEVRDTINWLYFSGFPKSLDVSKAIDKHFGAEREVIGKRKQGNIEGSISGKGTGLTMEGGKGRRGKYKEEGEFSITKPATKEAQQAEGIGTALKPAFEPATLCRKPLSEKTVALNWLKYRTGGINIDDCRFAYGDPCWVGPQGECGDRPVGGWQDQYVSGEKINNYHNRQHDLGRWPANIYQCPKASRSEREEGLEDMKTISGHEAVNRKEGSAGLNNPRAGAGRTASEVANIHPTVKPIKLMRWLIRLVTPKGGTILEPFCGSGTTMIASELEDNDYKCIGIEREPKYCDIIKARVQNAITNK